MASLLDDSASEGTVKDVATIDKQSQADSASQAEGSIIWTETDSGDLIQGASSILSLDEPTLRQLVTYLDNHELATLARVCSTLQTHALARLYERVTVRVADEVPYAYRGYHCRATPFAAMLRRTRVGNHIKSLKIRCKGASRTLCALDRIDA